MTQAVSLFSTPVAAGGASRQGAAGLFRQAPGGVEFGQTLAEQDRRAEDTGAGRDRSAQPPEREEGGHADPAIGEARRESDEAQARDDQASDAGAEETDRGVAAEEDAGPEDRLDGLSVEEADTLPLAEQTLGALVSAGQASQAAGLTGAGEQANPRATSRDPFSSTNTSTPAANPSGGHAQRSLDGLVQPVAAAAQGEGGDPLALQPPATPVVPPLAEAAPGSAASISSATAPTAHAAESALPPSNQPASHTAGSSAASQLTETQTTRESEQGALNNARLARGLSNAVKQGGGTVTLRLTPPEIGTVRIQMQLTGTALSASMHTETASAHQLLTQQLGQLRASLESQGLSVERLQVQPMQQAQPGSANEQAGDNPQQHNDGRSRGQQGHTGSHRREEGQDGDASGRSDEPTAFSDLFESTDRPATD